MLEIHIETANDAFSSGQAGEELARILRKLADQLTGTDFNEDVDEQCPLQDINGNVVGHYYLTVSPEDFE